MTSLKQFATRPRLEGLVILLVALGYLWEAHNVPEFYQLPGVPGPTDFPYLLGVIFAGCGLYMLISPADILARRKQATEAPPASAEPPKSVGARLAASWHFIAMWAVILAYLWLMPDLGFPLATVLLLTGFVYLLGETRWQVIAAMSLGGTAVIYLLFKIGLNVRLPLGILDVLVK